MRNVRRKLRNLEKSARQAAEPQPEEVSSAMRHFGQTGSLRLAHDLPGHLLPFFHFTSSLNTNFII